MFTVLFIANVGGIRLGPGLFREVGRLFALLFEVEIGPECTHRVSPVWNSMASDKSILLN